MAEHVRDEDTTIVLTEADILAQATDVDGDTLSLESVSYAGDDGTLVDNGDGTYNFTPSENFNGDITLDVSVSDGTATSTTTALVDVAAVNDLANFPDPSYTIDEDTSITLTADDILANATDVDGDTLTLESVDYTGDDGVLVANEDGSYTFTPAENFNGDLDLSATINDGTDSVSAAVHVQVDAVNDLTTNTGDVTATTDEDTAITVTQAQLLANAADIDGDVLTASNLQSDNATIVDNGDGTFTITPDAELNGLIDVSYDISDGVQPIAANLGLSVDPVNDAPVVSSDLAITIEEDGSYTVTQEDLLQYASDIEGDDLTALIGDQGSETTVTGTVLDAETGNPVEGADVTLSDTLGNATTVQTDNAGTYSVTGQVSGEGSVTIEQDGAITNSFNVAEGETTSSGTISLSEVMDATDMRIVVTWGGESGMRDLDNHLWLYDTETGSELDHIFYQDMNHQLGGGTVQQDVDDVNGYGPETITVPNYADANMHYSVHNYSARAWDVDGVDNVQVQVFVGESLVSTFTPDLPDDTTGDHWHVFDVVDGVIVPAQFAASESAFLVPDSAAVAANPDAVSIDDVISGADDSIEQEAESSSSATEATEANVEASIGDIAIANGVITDNGDGTYTITPNADFNGDLSINYTVEDGNGGVAPAQIDVTVTGTNDATILQDQSFTVAEDGSITITDAQLLNGAVDVDGGDLSVESVTYEGSDGVLTANGDGTYTFAPNENFTGDVDLSYAVSDGTATSTASIDISVEDVNDTPIVSGNLAYSVDEDGTITFSQAQLLANASDVDGDDLSANNLSAGDNATVTDNGDGTFTVAPDADFNGDINLSFDVIDSNGASISTGVDLTVNSINDGPVAEDDVATTDQDTAILIDVLANDSDVEGGLSISSVTNPVMLDGVEVGSAEIVSVPSSVQLELNASDATSKTGIYRGQLQEDESFLGGEIVINNTVYDSGIGMHPRPNSDAIATFDIPEGATSFSAIAGVTKLSDATSVNFRVLVDGVEMFSQDHVNWENDGQAVDIDVSGATELTLIVNSDGVNHSDHAMWANPVFSIDSQSGGAEQIQFSPNDYFDQLSEDEQASVSIDYVIEDEHGATAEATASVTVVGVNDAAEAGSVTPMTMAEDGAMEIDPDYILSFASDIDGDDLSLSALSLRDQSQGSLTQNPQTGVYSFSPAANFAGAVALDYVINDGTEDTAGSMEVNVTPVNDAAFVDGNAHATVLEDGAITFNVDDMLNLFGDVDGDSLTVSNVITAEGEDAEGEVVDNGDGTFTFTPETDFAGTTELQVIVSDGTVETAMDMPVYVRPVADGAVITKSQEGPIVMNEDETGFLSLGVELLDASENLSSLVMTGYPVGFTISDGEHTVTITEEGQLILINDWDISNISMDPPENWAGTFEVTVTATTVDYGDQNSNVLPASTEINGDFDATEGQDLIITELDLLDMAENTDVQSGDEVGLVHLIDNSQGTLVDNGDGTWTFSPADGFTGEVDFAYVIQRDGELFDEQSSVGVHPTVPGENNGPEIDGIATTEIDKGNAVEFTNDDLLAQISDVDGDALSVTGVQITNGGGVLEQAGDGTYTYTPDPEFSGEAQISFVASDGTDSVTSFVNVSVINAAPEIVDADAATGFSVEEDGSITFTEAELLSAVGATDANDDTMTVEGLGVQPDSGTVINNGDGSWTVWPDPDFSGDMQLTFMVNDGTDSTPATVPLEVTPENDAPTESAPLDIEMDVNGITTLTLDELLANVTDIDGDNLSVSNFQSDNATVTDNGDDTYSIVADGDFQGSTDIRFDVSDGTETVQASINANVSPAEDGEVDGNAADYTAAPGASLSIAMPSSISGDDSVDHVIVSDLPEGASVTNGLEDSDGNYVVSGDLSQPIQVSLGDGFEGDVSLNVAGFDSMDQPIDGASETIGLEIDDTYAMQGSSADNANVDVGGDDQTGGDWTNADNTDTGVDVMDDSSSFDNTNDNSGSNDDLSDLGGLG